MIKKWQKSFLLVFNSHLARELSSSTFEEKSDQYQYLGNCPPTPPLTQHPNINLLSIDYCWVRGGVGGQLPRYLYWPEKSISTRALVLFSTYVIELTISETILLDFFQDLCISYWWRFLCKLVRSVAQFEPFSGFCASRKLMFVKQVTAKDTPQYFRKRSLSTPR